VGNRDDFITQVEKNRVVDVLSEYGYIDLGDVNYWHLQDPNDPEPKGLLEWYKAYDDAYWSIIEDNPDIDPLIADMEAFNKTKNLLPQEEDD